MGTFAGSEIDAWLRQGGQVVTASERTARALTAAFNRARKNDGLSAWIAPSIQDWNSFIRSAWMNLAGDERLILNVAQEQSVWAEIAAAEGLAATMLDGPRQRLAAMAMEAHHLICSHAPKYLRAATRAGWQNDAGVFSRWLSDFDVVCRSSRLLSPARLPVELLALLEHRPPEQARMGILLAGFDRMQPIQKAVFERWGECREVAPGKRAERIYFYEARDDQSELAACAEWCRREIAAQPDRRLLVITQNAAKRRGQIEREFSGHSKSGGAPPFEFSLGVPLSEVGLARAALLLLRWLSAPIAEYELDWLFSSGFGAANAQESAMLEAHMRALRRRGLERPQWTVQSFLYARAGMSMGLTQAGHPLREWSRRIRQTQQRLGEVREKQSPFDWAELTPQLLDELSFAKANALTSAEFQAFRRLQSAIETAGSLGFHGGRISWPDFLAALVRAMETTLFAPESRDAAIQIAGPAESAGLSADSIWFLGASEEAWPGGGATHPLLPPEVQRQTGMPHASPQLDWDLAQTMTDRLLTFASKVCFSYARQMDGVEARPSRLIARIAPQHAMPTQFAVSSRPTPLTQVFEDSSRVPFLSGQVAGGAGVLTNQSQCPFKAFATARLGAQAWNQAQAVLTPAQRGQILHAVLHLIWGGPPKGIRSHAELLQIADRASWVAELVREVFASDGVASLGERMPARYLELEQERLVGLIVQWLDYESTRIPFDVLKTEAQRSITLGGLTFDLRLDRIDKLIDGSLLVIDYKTGDVTPSLWKLPRPEDVQLPLYAGFGFEFSEQTGGLVFAKLRAGKNSFTGCVTAPANTLFMGLNGTSALMRNCLTCEQLTAWREAIEQLAEDFVFGRADVDPREYPNTCKRCGLQTLCRVQENRIAFDDEGDGANGSGEASE